MLKGYMLTCRNAEGVHGKKKVGNPWSDATSRATQPTYIDARRYDTISILLLAYFTTLQAAT